MGQKPSTPSFSISGIKNGKIPVSDQEMRPLESEKQVKVDLFVQLRSPAHNIQPTNTSTTLTGPLTDATSGYTQGQLALDVDFSFSQNSETPRRSSTEIVNTISIMFMENKLNIPLNLIVQNLVVSANFTKLFEDWKNSLTSGNKFLDKFSPSALEVWARDLLKKHAKQISKGKDGQKILITLPQQSLKIERAGLLYSHASGLGGNGITDPLVKHVHDYILADKFDVLEFITNVIPINDGEHGVKIFIPVNSNLFKTLHDEWKCFTSRRVLRRASSRTLATTLTTTTSNQPLDMSKFVEENGKFARITSPSNRSDARAINAPSVENIPSLDAGQSSNDERSVGLCFSLANYISFALSIISHYSLERVCKHVPNYGQDLLISVVVDTLHLAILKRDLIAELSTGSNSGEEGRRIGYGTLLFNFKYTGYYE